MAGKEVERKHRQQIAIRHYAETIEGIVLKDPIGYIGGASYETLLLELGAELGLVTMVDQPIDHRTGKRKFAQGDKKYIVERALNQALNRRHARIAKHEKDGFAYLFPSDNPPLWTLVDAHGVATREYIPRKHREFAPWHEPVVRMDDPFRAITARTHQLAEQWSR